MKSSRIRLLLSWAASAMGASAHPYFPKRAPRGAGKRGSSLSNSAPAGAGHSTCASL